MTGHTHHPLSADDLLKKMREGVKEVHNISLRGFNIPVRVLSLAEMNLIRKDAISQALANKGDGTDVNVITQQTVLKMASTIDSSGGPLLSDKVLERMTTDELNYLYNEYVRVSESVNPSVEHISHDAFRELVNALKKNMITSVDLSLPQLRAICTAYVALISEQANHS
jgi:hypothetical protein